MLRTLGRTLSSASGSPLGWRRGSTSSWRQQMRGETSMLIEHMLRTVGTRQDIDQFLGA